MAAETMKNENNKINVHPEPGPVDLTKRVTLYAPAGAANHKEGEETQVAEALVAKFELLGYTKTKPKSK